MAMPELEYPYQPLPPAPPSDPYVHEALYFTPKGDAPLPALLSGLAKEMDKCAADGWEVLGPPQAMLQGPAVIGGQPKVTWVIWSRRLKSTHVPIPAPADHEAESAPRPSLIEACGSMREAVQV